MLCKRSCAFLIVDSTFHGQWHYVRVRSQPPNSSKFDGLGPRATFANRTGAFVEVVKERCQNCSSQPCLSFGEPRSLQERQVNRNHNFGSATS